MEITAVPQRRTRLGLGAIGVLAALALSLACLASPVAAAPLVGKDGTMHACYKVRGKSKGTMRLVTAKAHCRRGERKANWSLVGPVGPSGQNGGKGDTGAAGAPGASGLPGEAALKSTVIELTNEVDLLKAKLEGITGLQLQETVASLADTSALCTRATALTAQVNLLGTAIGGISLGGTIPPLLSLVIPGLPAALPAFSCP